MHRVVRIILQLILCCVLSFTAYASDSKRSEAFLSFRAPNPDAPLKVALAIDNAQKIAGMKVKITYDSNLLKLKLADKAEATSSFLHVVNDKNPGRVIIVMASAKGISGSDLNLCTLEFEKANGQDGIQTQISVTELQLMTENLVEVSGNYPDFTFQF